MTVHVTYDDHELLCAGDGYIEAADRHAVSAN